MKLTKSKLKQLIKEELNALNELGRDWEKEVETQKGLSPLTRAQADELAAQFTNLQQAHGERDVDPGEEQGLKAHKTYLAAWDLTRELISLLAKSPDELESRLKPRPRTLAALAAYRENL